MPVLKRIAIPKSGGPRSMAQWKAFFLDRESVKRMVGPGVVRGMARYGAIVRRVAQTSMRYRKKASAPGQPPSAHKDGRLAALKKQKRAKHNGALLRELLFFAYDPSTRSVVIGPMGFKGSDVPALHEYGGTRTAKKGDVMAVKNPAGRNPRTGRFYSRGVQLIPLAGKTLHYPKRPTMAPALKKTKESYPRQFRNMLRLV